MKKTTTFFAENIKKSMHHKLKKTFTFLQHDGQLSHCIQNTSRSISQDVQKFHCDTFQED